ncbi:MAG: helix-turn-helix domain-containing protein [Campylobacter sp.]|nr:helix-turn-helix domain-containing protein [Campylobacter sp.]
MQGYTKFDDMLQEQMQDPEFRAEYEALKPWRELQIQLIEARHKAKLTQEQLAQKLGINRPNLAKFETKLENPTFESLVNYARAVGLKKLVISL